MTPQREEAERLLRLATRDQAAFAALTISKNWPAVLRMWDANHQLLTLTFAV